ncbi:S8 family serine peptidase [Niallia sp. 03133]|uniref:S8 family serine peptidase n=1 Tax=Niallia sp. 03133 TaxID=3458060 RepID=UPI00404419AF
MKKGMTLLLILFLFSFASNVLAAETKKNSHLSTNNVEKQFDSNKEFKGLELIIKFNSWITDNERQLILSSASLEEKSFYKGFSLAKAASKDAFKIAADRLVKDTKIEFVEPNYTIKASYTPKDSFYPKQWYLNKLNNQQAWDATKGSKKITVAVIDGGMQTNHPEFKGRILSPFNAVTESESIKTDVHGTHVAGIIAAANDNKGTVGIAPNVQIMPINIFSGDGADAYDESVGIMYAVDHGANIINMSYNSLEYTYTEEYAIDYAASRGVVLVAAAGNDGNNAPNYPAAYDSVISVTAVDQKDRLANFSNYGTSIDISAPGVNIYSTVPASHYRSMDGTSMAAPMVSGVAALILSKNPLLTPEDVKHILTSTAKDLGAKGLDERFGYGRIDAGNALQNTPAPLSNMKVDTNSFNIDGNRRNNISISIYKGSSVSITVENAKRKTVKTLVSNKKWNGGNLSAPWDGTDDQNHLVPEGTYSFVVKAKNNKEIVSKAKKIKVSHEKTASLTLKSSSSDHFSPARKKKGTASFRLTKKAKINAKIIDNNGKTVKTLLSKKQFAAGSYSLTWDGKDKGKKEVKDGTYQLVVSIADIYSRIKPASLRMVVDTKAPSSKKEKLSSTNLQMNGKNQITSTLELPEDAAVTAYIQTDKGSSRKKLTNKKPAKAGKTTFRWNGKNDKNDFVEEGNYYYYYEIFDKAGNSIRKKGASFIVQDWQKPSLILNNVNYDKTSGELLIPYTASKSGIIHVELSKDKKTVNMLEKETSAGSQTITWNGKDKDGNTAEDGKYEIKMTMIDSYHQSITKTAIVAVGSTPITLEAPATVQYNSEYVAEKAAEVFYKLSKDADVTIKIFDTYSNLVKTIQDHALVHGGVNSFSWDGKDNDGYWGMDNSFTYEITADAGTEKQTLKGSITTEKPAWLKKEQLTNVPSNNGEQESKGIDLHITTESDMTLKWDVYDDENNLITNQKYNLTKGLFTAYYEKPSPSKEYHYKLTYTDALGNQYMNKYDE